MGKEILKIENLSKSFGGLKLFEGVTFSLREGTINSLLGSNGSGKTTFFNLIGGYEKPDTGKIHFNGVTVKTYNEFALAKAGIGRMWQDPTIFPNHTVLENLLVSAKHHPGESLFNYVFRQRLIKNTESALQQDAMSVLKKLGLSDKAEQLAGSLSLGEKKLLSISMLLMNDARLLLLDEPFSGVNPGTIEKISQCLITLKQEGKTIFMIEHKIRFAKAISDRLFKIENCNIHELN
jgi:ABC-type branched-subunit amino acid transport system ATPase component